MSALRESKQKNLIIMLAEPTVNHLKMPGRWELTLHVDINLHTHSCQSMLKLKAELVLGWIPGPKSHSSHSSHSSHLSHSSHSSHVCFPPCVGDLQLQNLPQCQIRSADLSRPIKGQRNDNEYHIYQTITIFLN